MLRAVALVVATAPLMLPGAARAADWLGDTVDFNLGANWSGGAVPINGTAAFINNDALRNATVTNTAGTTRIALIEFSADAPAYTITTVDGVVLFTVGITNNSAVEQNLVAGAAVTLSGIGIVGTITGAVALTAETAAGIQVEGGASAVDTRFVGAGGYMLLNTFTGQTLSLGSIEGTGNIFVNGNATLSVGGLDSDTTYAGTIHDSLGLTKVGTGTLTLTNAGNVYTGGTTFEDGTISVAADGALGDASGELTFNGGTLQTTASFATARTIALQVPASAGTTFDTATGTTLTVSGVVSGGGALVKDGAGTLVLTNAGNSYVGGTTLVGGTVSVAANRALGDPAGGLTFNGGTLRTTASFTTVRSVTISSTGTFETDAGTTLTVTSGIGGAGRLAKDGAGTLTLTGANTYSNGTLVAEGVLTVTGAGSITHASQDLRVNGGTFNILAGADVTNYMGIMAVASGDVATMVVDGAGSSWTSTNELRIGFAGEATLTVSGGASMISGDSSFFGNFGTIGDDEGSIGDVTVTGDDSTWVNETNLLLGLRGTGTLTVEAGAEVTIQGSTSLGGYATGDGTLEVTGPGTSFTTRGINVGGDGVASVSVLNGATLTSETSSGPGSLFGLSTVAAQGSVLVSGTGSTWDSDAWFYLNGTLTVAQGGSVTVDSTGLREIRLSTSGAGGVLNIGGAVGEAAVATGALNIDLVSATSAGTLNFNHTGTNYTFSPIISGAMTVNAVSGTTFLNASNSYTGGTNIGAATIRLGTNTALGTGSVDMTDAGARLLINGREVAINGLDGVADSEVDLGSSVGSALGLTAATGSYSFAGNIIGGVSPAAPIMVKDGGSTQTLSGDNSFMGVVSVFDGTLVLASNTALSSNAFVTVATGAQVTVDGVDVAIAELAPTLGGDGTVLLDGGSLTVALDGAINAFGGVITGTGAFGVDGTGLIQTLTGVNDYTGGTTITEGALRLTGTGALATTGAIELAGSSAVFDISDVTGDRTIGDLSGVTGSSVVIGSHELTVGTSIGSEFDGVISGTGGTLIKAGTGTLTLGGANTFDGGTTVSAGRLNIDGSLAGALTARTGTTLGGSGEIGGLVTLENGSTLAAGNSPGTLTVGSLVLDAGTSLDFELGDAGVVGGATNDLVVVTNDLTLAGELNVIDSGTFGLGTYTLFTYGDVLMMNPLTFGSAPIGYNVGNFSIDTGTAGAVNLIVAAAATDQYWDNGTGTWNAGDTNWTNENGSINAVWGGQTAIFRDIAGTVTVDGAQSFSALRFETDGYVIEGPGSLEIAGVQGDIRVDTGYTATISAAINGTGMLAKGGAGRLVLSGNNTYEGGTLIAGGILAVSSDQNLGEAAGGVTLDGGTLQLVGPSDMNSARAFSVTATGGAIDTNGFNLNLDDIDATGALTKFGAGTLAFKGTANLAGGLLLDQGGLNITLGDGATFTGDIDTNVGTNVTLRAGAATGSYDGSISGFGDVLISGPGAITLSGVSTYEGTTTVDFGTILALTGAGSIAETDLLQLAGTFDISGTDNGASIGSLTYDGAVLLGDKTLTLTDASSVYSGTISGAGGLSITGGVQSFAGTSTYGGATFIAEGAIMEGLAPDALAAASAFTVDGLMVLLGSQTIGSLAGSGTVFLDDLGFYSPLSLTVGGDGTSTAFSGNLQGDGTLIKTGAGTLSLGGNLLGFDGGITVNGGTLALNTLFTGGIDVLSDGTLGGTGTVSSVTAGAGGTIAPGNSIGTLNVTGNATFGAGSTYQVEIDTTGASDLLAVGGIATLGGATVDVLKAAGSYTAGTRYTILTAAGGVSGTFGTLTQDLPFLDLALAYDASDVYLDIARNEVNFASIGNTPNERAVGGAVETLGPGNAVYDSVASQTSNEAARAAFNSLSGEIGASAKGVLIGDSQFVRNTVFERLVTAGSAAPSGMSVAPLGYAAPAKPQKADDVPYPTKAEPLDIVAPASAVWAQGFGSWGSTDGNGNAASIDRSTGGFLIGADTLVGDWRLGVLGGYSQTSFDVDARASSGTSDNIHAGLYAGTNWGAVNFRTGAAYTWNDISTSRTVGIPVPQLLEADYDAGTAQVFGELGYGLTFGAVDFEPFAGLAYVNLHTDGFNETGGPAALTSSSDSTDATYTTLGLRASTTLNTGSFATTLRGMLGWRHAFGDITPTMSYQFAAGGSPFTVEGLPIAEDALVLDLGLDVAISDAASLGVFYSAQFGDSAQDQSVRGTLNWKF